jgi:shikimate kinase
MNERATAPQVRYPTPMQPARRIENLALIGFMGTGKSSVGQLLAGQLHFQFLDTDRLIEERAGASINDLFAQHGEAVFRDLERKVVEELSTQRGLVISTGGGLAASEANLASLKTHALVVCLWATPEVIWQRVKHQSHRPLLNCPEPLDRIRELLAQREPHYRRADVLINSEMRSVKEVAHQVLHQFQNARLNPPHQ